MKQLGFTLHIKNSLKYLLKQKQQFKRKLKIGIRLVRTQNEPRFIEENNEALLQRIRLIQNAREEIILSTFAFHSDESGKLIMGALLEAANRGI